MNPLLTLAVLLGIAFMMPLLEKAGRNVARTFFLAGLGFLFIYSGMMAFELISGFDGLLALWFMRQAS